MKRISIYIILCCILTGSAFPAHGDQEESGKEEIPDISVYDKRREEMDKVKYSPFGIVLYKPNYMQPAYYTFQKYDSVYRNNTPDNQEIQNFDFKFQLSILLPLWENVFHHGTDLNFAYTQVSFWQLYQKSAFFRETDYEPDIFLHHTLSSNIGLVAGAVHQSNGRGGDMERSWNRAYIGSVVAGRNWMMKVTGWYPFLKNESIDINNADIMDYMGYGQILLSYKLYAHVFSIQMNNYIESRFDRGSFLFTWSFHLFGHIRWYVSYFNGYGQSLIEYDHYSKSIGVGIALNDWI